MHCPKCKEFFEEGSRRFCPTDGARLVSATTGVTGGRGEGGIFANLIPKIDGIRDLDETLSDAPRFSITEPAKASFEHEADDPDDGIFFELDEVLPTSSPETVVAKPAQSMMETSIFVEPKPAVRKVNPYEIPAGHVDLGDSARLPGMAAEFDSDNPEHFVGRTVKGRYRVTEFLGGDESGLAYLADDRIVEDRLVLVRILTGGGETDEIMDSILAEERVSLSHFSHPNIARLIDSGQFTNGTDFLVSEYVDALSVGDILSIHGRFPDQRAARVIRQAASALNEAHQEGILHRDVRPENLIIDTAAGEVEQTTVVNFGASNGDPTPRNMAYKAHEVLDGRIATVSSDIFSLAVVAYEMLTGRLPFSGASAKELVRSQSSGLDHSAGASELGNGVAEVFTKAFSFNTADRYPKARDFGDAFCGAVAESQPVAAPLEAIIAPPPPPPVFKTEMLKPIVPPPLVITPVVDIKSAATVKPLVPPTAPPPSLVEKPDPIGNRRSILGPILGVLGLAALVWALWYYYVNKASQPVATPPAGNNVVQTNSVPPPPSPAANTELPPQPRTIAAPPNSTFYQNLKENLKGDLLRNFVGFSMYYPTDWKVNGPQSGATTKARGKFIDIARTTPDGSLKEQMLVSYYPSRGTFAEDAAKFPALVKETNETLERLVPGYRMVAEREIKFNGEWRAYEIKFQFDGKSPTGEKIPVWGRRLFVPTARPGARNGFEITMLATPAAQDVKGVDDIGFRGELASILNTFEPNPNF